jgi:hypothetical protein
MRFRFTIRDLFWLTLSRMKLDYLSDKSISQPIIRLYDFNGDEVERLYFAFRDLAGGRLTECRVHELDGVESADGVRLTLFVQSWD